MYLDTNILLYMIQERFDAFYPLPKLEALIKEGHVRIVLSELVVDEFNRNKEVVAQRARDTIQYRVDSISSLEKNLHDQVPSYTAVMETIRNNMDRLLRFNVDRKLKAIDDLIEQAEILSLTDQMKIQAADWGLAKMPPFFGSKGSDDKNKDVSDKNSMADALIFMGARDYTISDGDRLIFVTENYTDFSDVNPKKQNIHPVLKEMLTDRHEYCISFSEVIGKIIEQTGITVMSREEAKRESQISDDSELRKNLGIDIPNDTLVCPNCLFTLSDSDGHWGRGVYEQSWIRECPGCKLQWDSGDPLPGY